MSKYRLTDVLMGKKEGDEWYCLAAPEETRMWLKKNPWDRETFSKHGITPVSLKIESGEVSAVQIDKFSYKNPLILKSGLDITKGQIKTRQYKSAQFEIRVDSCIEFNEIMKELSQKTGLETWEVKKIVIYNKDVGVSTEFKLHNPNGTGTGLYTHRFEKEKTSRLYPEVMISDQMLYVKTFYDTMAHCAACKNEELIHACAIEKKITKKQVIRRTVHRHER
jgi:hypothetical protein